MIYEQNTTWSTVVPWGEWQDHAVSTFRKDAQPLDMAIFKDSMLILLHRMMNQPQLETMIERGLSAIKFQTQGKMIGRVHASADLLGIPVVYETHVTLKYGEDNVCETVSHTLEECRHRNIGCTYWNR